MLRVFTLIIDVECIVVYLVELVVLLWFVLLGLCLLLSLRSCVVVLIVYVGGYLFSVCGVVLWFVLVVLLF